MLIAMRAVSAALVLVTSVFAGIAAAQESSSATSASSAGPSAAPASPSPSSGNPPRSSRAQAPASSGSSSINVLAKPTSVPPPEGDITSNVTDTTSATATAKWDIPLPPLINEGYRGTDLSRQNLPVFGWALQNSSLSDDTLNSLCEMQTHFCETSGCSDPDDEISNNFCDVKKGMAVMCTCKKSYSRLNQYEWPVQMQDCLFRLQACLDTCNHVKSTPYTKRDQCTKACGDQIGSSCGKSQQYGASYAVKKRGATPNYAIVDQSQPQSAGSRVQASTLLIAGVVAAAVTLLASGA